MCRSFSALSGTGDGRVGHQVAGLLRLGEGDHVADVVLARQQHDDAVDAGRDAAVRRRAVLERLQQVAEAGVGLFFAE